ncbi:MAG: DUF4340 domain-containing protein [Alphaproteobacteria bacterium]|nr:DUF4340 domain-containing protein [Alphaproteobacteria bacterium]MBU0798359.1 DUF4340 domain-containing protein [Alphaproteobacteria bacterium]MBU0887460.1 DUF4340 domain-containing protein [Alphaproteobacteria bacterium]MBU1813331.1 DUF4340 domain-containing protein [Alphaproteobacteria bacterium]
MTLRSFYILLLVTAIAVLGAAGIVYQRNAAAIGVLDSDPVFPGLTDRLNDVTTITLASAEGRTTLTRKGEHWAVGESHDYPARSDSVRALLLALADMKTMEAKTSRPEMFSRLEVEAQESEKAKSTLIALRDGSGAVLAELLVGKRRFGRGGQGDAYYVRRPGSNQALLAESRLDPRSQPLDWLDRRIASIDRDQVRQVTITHPDGESLSVGKDSAETNDFVIRDMPEGTQIENQFQLNATAGTLNQLVLDAVRPAEGLSFGTAGTRYETFDGLVVEVTFAEADGTTWTRYRASTTAEASDDAKAKAAEINMRTEGWAYALTDFKIEQLRRRMADLVKPAGKS